MSDINSLFLVALGGNLPFGGQNVASNLVSAVLRLAEKGLRPRAISRFFATPCFPPGAGPDYVNAAISAESTLPPAAVLALLHEVEQEFGRERQARWGARGLDLDLLACGQRVCPDPATQRRWIDLAPERRSREVPGALILPHPRLQERAFVLGPLRDICPDWQHPVLQQTVEQLYDSLPKADIAAIRPL